MKAFILVSFFALAVAIAYGAFNKDGKLWGTDEERAEIIKSAISEAKMNAKMKEAASRAKMFSRADQGPTAMDMLARGFKKPSKKAIANGKARILLESTIKIAERKLYELKKSLIKDAPIQDKTELIAEELYHRPGSILREKELTEIIDNTGCRNELVLTSDFCSSVANVNRFRTINGACNNLGAGMTTLGASATAFSRVIPADYEDGNNVQRGFAQANNAAGTNGRFGTSRPSARLVSKEVVADLDAKENGITHALMQWGQFLDHDLDLGPEIEEECEECLFTDICHPIFVKDNDPVFGAAGTNPTTHVGTGPNGEVERCLHFRRAVPVCRNNPPGTFTPREQLNDVTSFIDGSMVYGSNREQEEAVRTSVAADDGKLRVDNRNLLPRRKDEEFIACPLPADRTDDCFLCGEVRCNEQVSLTTMHTLWVRYHNIIAHGLRRQNPHWDGERIFQEARKIVGAIIQKITYEDYLKIVLGNAYDIVLGEYKGYDPRVDPSVPNSFATAAYRYGHSLIKPSFKRLSKNFRNAKPPLQLKDMFFRPSLLANRNDPDQIARGWTDTISRQMDEFVNSILTTVLFKQTTLGGMDLASLNIQRQRDHGMADYSDFRDFCAGQFGSLFPAKFRNSTTQALFNTLYGSSDLTDLWIAGLAEKRAGSSLLGPTFTCLFGITFGNVRNGDRFFYLKPGVFTRNQRVQLKRTSLSRVICDSTNTRRLQRNAFLSVTRRRSRRRVLCRRIPTLNLRFWRETVRYVRVVRSGERRIPIALQSFESTKELAPTMFTNKKSERCIAMVAPTSSKDVGIFVFPHIKDKNSCRFKSELSYRSIEGESSSFYHPKITEDLATEENGFYKTLEDCESGSTNAITYTCDDDNVEVLSSSSIPELNDHDIRPFEDIQNPDSYSQVPDGLVKIMNEYMADLEQKVVEENHSEVHELEDALLKANVDRPHMVTDKELYEELNELEKIG
jgi:peroxidase